MSTWRSSGRDLFAAICLLSVIIGIGVEFGPAWGLICGGAIGFTMAILESRGRA